MLKSLLTHYTKFNKNIKIFMNLYKFSPTASDFILSYETNQ